MYSWRINPHRSRRLETSTSSVTQPGSDASGHRAQHVCYRRIVAAAAAVAAAGAIEALSPASAEGLTPSQLTTAGWICIQPRLAPQLLLCTPPGVGLPPLPGTSGFADRAPSYQFLVFGFSTGAHLGTELLLRPDIYEHGQPPCPQQPGGQFIYNPRNDLWFCNKLGVDPSA
jgi:hypothetical protein